MFYFINSLPILVHVFVFFPLNYMEDVLDTPWIMSVNAILLIFIEIATPIFLTIWNMYAVRKKDGGYFKSLLVMVCVVLISAAISYSDWGIRTGNFFNPDDLTVGIAVWAETIFPIIFIFIVWSIFGICRYIKRRHRGTV